MANPAASPSSTEPRSQPSQVAHTLLQAEGVKLVPSKTCALAKELRYAKPAKAARVLSRIAEVSEAVVKVCLAASE
jgi:hypothetical protein